MMRLFFFSSRRRHTISLRDWSSDVCSSDLFGLGAVLRRHAERIALVLPMGYTRDPFCMASENCTQTESLNLELADARSRSHTRSEERRVGKACRPRGWPYQYKIYF